MTTHCRMLVLQMLFVCASTLAYAAPPSEPVSFLHQVRPLLSDNCFACHGPDAETREADLRLDLSDQAIESGSIVPGDPDASELVRRLESSDPDARMPPEESHKELSREEIETIRRWITEGAKYEQHWSYRPLERPDVPSPPQADIASPIDAFILNQLNARNLTLSPRADSTTLVRRLFLDLLGVPPSYAEIERFSSDNPSDAVGNLVDQLLRDPRYGERMAVFWLDLVRYADTIGYHSDTHMEVSAYRDYVIDAFNANMPFDQFTIEQLAGDLLPSPTTDQQVASGYNRLLQTTEEGGAQAKEYLAIYAADRVRNVSGVWMGQTVGCAQCHDHKYDPITSKDFYSMAAFFADIKETAVGKQKPNLTVITPEDQQRIDQLAEQIEALGIDQILAQDPELAKQVTADQRRWAAKLSESLAADESVWNLPPSPEASANRGVKLEPQDDGSFLSRGENPKKGTYTYQVQNEQPLSAIRLEVFPDKSFQREEGFSRGNGNFVLSKITVFVDDQPVDISGAVASYQQDSHPIGDSLDDDDETGWAVDGHIKTASKRAAMLRFDPPAPAGRLRIELRHHSRYERHQIGRFRISLSDQPDASIGTDFVAPDAVVAALKRPAAERSEDEQRQIAKHFHAVSDALAESREALAKAEKGLADFRASLRKTLISESMPEPRMTRILPRGNWLDDSGEVVEPAVPEFLPQEPITDRRANRLDLAKWLMAENNPLTARTFVNRLWKLFYGRGLSKNLDDLGGQGEAPTHPELLDWLAVEFRDSGWDIKSLIRTMVTTHSYAQSSIAPANEQDSDPTNRYYGHQNRWRIEAEFVRDTALTVSGLLVQNGPGGPSVKPYQPVGYWRHLNFPTRKWKADQGDKLYRRSLYTFWCRSFPHPSMIAFDAPSREECTAERARSNIPQQALVLLNDPIFVEAARFFAERIMSEAESTEQRIVRAYEIALSRSPSEQELELLSDLHENQQQRFTASADDAQQLLSVGATPASSKFDAADLAAWTQVTRAIINAYETTSRF